MFVSKTPYVYPTLNSGALNEFRAMECTPISVLLLRDKRKKFCSVYFGSIFPHRISKFAPTQMEHTQESFQVLKCVEMIAYERRNNSKI